MSSGRLVALGDAKLVTPHINVEFEKCGKSSLLLDPGKSAGFVITKALYLLRLKHLLRIRPSSRQVETAGASPLDVLGEVTFDAFVLTGQRGRVRSKAQVVPVLPGVDGYLSMREITAVGANILTAATGKLIEL